MSPVTHTTHTNIKSCTYHRFKPLPFTPPISGPDIRITLNSRITFTGMCQSSHIIIFLELAIGSFRISQRKNIMKFLQIHRSSDIRLYKPGPDGSYFHYSVLPPPVHGFRIKEIHQPFCLCSGIQNISLLTRLIQQMIFRAII